MSLQTAKKLKAQYKNEYFGHLIERIVNEKYDMNTSYSQYIVDQVIAGGTGDNQKMAEMPATLEFPPDSVKIIQFRALCVKA